jgi:hypothetical protein
MTRKLEAGNPIPQYVPEEGYDPTVTTVLLPAVPTASSSSWNVDLDPALDQALDLLVDSVCCLGMGPTEDALLTSLNSKYCCCLRSLYEESARAKRAKDHDSYGV